MGQKVLIDKNQNSHTWTPANTTQAASICDLVLLVSIQSDLAVPLIHIDIPSNMKTKKSWPSLTSHTSSPTIR